jgi:uncharacterized membrane protein
METNQTLESPIQPESVETPAVEAVKSPDTALMLKPASSNSYSTQSGRSNVNDALRKSGEFFETATRFVRENQDLLSAIGLIVLGIISLKVLFAVLDTLDGIPLLSFFLKSLGLGYSIWFANRYLLKTSSRQELSEKVRGYKDQVWGSQPLLPSANFSSIATNSSNSEPGDKKGLTVKKSVTVHQSPDYLYRFWRNFENLPHFMNHIESVKSLDEKRSHWVMKAPLGTQVEWDAEILNDEEPKTIVWRSLPGADVDSVGSVAFNDANGSGTEVKVTMEYNPPGGALGATVASLFGENPEQQLEEDLNRFKELMEAAAVPAA